MLVRKNVDYFLDYYDELVPHVVAFSVCPVGVEENSKLHDYTSSLYKATEVIVICTWGNGLRWGSYASQPEKDNTKGKRA